MPRQRLAPNAVAVAAAVLQSLVGAWFVVSALAKLFDIDSFEVYLFSFSFVPLGIAMVAARVVIAVELFLGLALMCGLMPRAASLALLLLTLFFCCFLAYAEWIGRTDNCHCMGALMAFSPMRSLLKNAVLVLLLLTVRRMPLFAFRPRWYVWLLAAVLPVTVAFACSVPDNWMYGAGQEQYNETLLHELAADGQPLSDAHLAQGRHVLVLASEGCRYCRMALQKLRAIAVRHQLDQSHFVVVLAEQPSSPPDGVPQLQGRRFRLPNAQFFQLSYGRFPTVVLLDNGRPYASYHYRNINEKEITQFLTQ